MGKWATPDLSYLENDLSNTSIKSIYLQLINIIPKKLYTKNIEKVIWPFLRKLAKVSKQPNFTFFGPFGPWKITFRVSQWNPSFDSLFVPALGSFMPKYRKGYQTVVEKIGSKWRMSQIWPFLPLWMTLWWFNQISILQYIGTFLRKLHGKNEKSFYRPFLRNQALRQTDRRTDDSALEKFRCLLLTVFLHSSLRVYTMSFSNSAKQLITDMPKLWFDCPYTWRFSIVTKTHCIKGFPHGIHISIFIHLYIKVWWVGLLKIPDNDIL